MKFLGMVFFLALALATARAQEALPEWFRVQTFDDKSAVELYTNYVMFSTDQTARVRMRWTYAEPQNLVRDSQIKYQSVMQEIGFDCRNKKYHIYETKFFDAEGGLLKTSKPKENGEWQDIGGKTMRALFPHACRLIDFRKREPLAEQ